jgi:uncharacterized protein YjiS (DUF1127 family)
MVTRSLPTLFATRRAPVQVSVRSVWARLGAILRTRQTRHLLMEMEPRMLADIGIGRGEAMHEANRPFWDVDAR